MNITAKVALRMIPDSLATQPIFLCVDDTMVAKAGTRFENVSKLFDHAAHNGSNYLNGHCFVSIMLCTPVWKNDRVSYLSLPLGYRMWQKKESKLELAASMIRQVMPEFQEKKQGIKDLKTADSSISLFFIFIRLILFGVNVNSLYPIHVLNAMRIVNSRKLWYNQVIMVSISIQNIKGEKKYERA